jgi:hypothetical protein
LRSLLLCDLCILINISQSHRMRECSGICQFSGNYVIYVYNLPAICRFINCINSGIRLLFFSVGKLYLSEIPHAATEILSWKLVTKLMANYTSFVTRFGQKRGKSLGWVRRYRNPKRIETLLRNGRKVAIVSSQDFGIQSCGEFVVSVILVALLEKQVYNGLRTATVRWKGKVMYGMIKAEFSISQYIRLIK